MNVSVRCKFCKRVIVNDTDAIKYDKYIQCPFCFSTYENILYEGEDD